MSLECGNKNKNPKMGSDIRYSGTSFHVSGNNNIDKGEFGGGVLPNNNQLEAEEEAFIPDPIWRNTNRRTWTVELHAKFVQALSHLKGPEGN